jgi:hypothetical protein
VVQFDVVAPAKPANLHFVQDCDEYGVPKFNKQTERPVFTMRGHDVEELVGVVRRYGADAAGVRALIESAAVGLKVAAVNVAQCCGTCLRA